MYEQDLFDKTRKTEAVNMLTASPEEDYSKKFINWVKQNWHIYLAFEKRALRLIRAKAKNAGAKSIVENIRWQSLLAEADQEFKINNNYTADLARLFEFMNPKYKGFFRQRIRRV